MKAICLFAMIQANSDKIEISLVKYFEMTVLTLNVYKWYKGYSSFTIAL